MSTSRLIVDKVETTTVQTTTVQTSTVETDTVGITTLKSKGTGFNDVVSFQNASGTENGTLCRAWVNFDGTFGTSPFTIANGGIRDAFNVSSVTDNGTGNYTLNFTNSIQDANYATNLSYSAEVSVQHTVGFVYDVTSSSVRVQHYNAANSGNAVDKGYVAVSIFH